LPAVNIPTPNQYAKDHGHNPFPTRWERWLSSVREAIITSQPTAGRHVSVDEHPGKGTVINIDDTSARRPGGGATGACCHVDGTCTIETESSCDGAYQGDGTICEDFDCTHTGACCNGADCSITREEDCGGTYQGDGTTCDPNPCETPACSCGEGFMFAPFHDPVGGGYYASITSDCCALMTTYADPVLSTARFATMSSVNTACGAGFTGSNSCTYIIDPDTCEQVRTECTGTIHDPDSNCVNDCAFDCDCNTGSCQPHVTNTTTLSDQCTP
jgi:hypothetical protein